MDVPVKLAFRVLGAAAVALSVRSAACLGADGATMPATLPAAAPATAPATMAATAPAIQATFESGEPIEDLLSAISLRYEVLIIQPEQIKASILKKVQLPGDLDGSIDLVEKTLAAQGYGVIRSISAQGRLVLKLATAEEEKAAERVNAMVSTGSDPAKIDVSKPDREVTHLLPIRHGEMIDSLRRTATQQKEITVNLTGTAAGGYTMLVSGPALKVRDAVDAVVKIDGRPDLPVAAKAVTLINMDAVQTAASLNAGFARDDSGMKAVADARTNTVIITGPENRVTDTAMNLTAQDVRRNARPVPRLNTSPLFTPPPPPGRAGSKAPAPQNDWTQRPFAATMRGSNNGGIALS